MKVTRPGLTQNHADCPLTEETRTAGLWTLSRLLNEEGINEGFVA